MKEVTWEWIGVFHPLALGLGAAIQLLTTPECPHCGKAHDGLMVTGSVLVFTFGFKWWWR